MFRIGEALCVRLSCYQSDGQESRLQGHMGERGRQAETAVSSGIVLWWKSGSGSPFLRSALLLIIGGPSQVNKPNRAGLPFSAQSLLPFGLSGSFSSFPVFCQDVGINTVQGLDTLSSTERAWKWFPMLGSWHPFCLSLLVPSC